MFNRKILFLSLLVVGILFTGCSKEPKTAHVVDDEVVNDDVVDDSIDDDTIDNNQTILPPVVSFNMTGADALGGRDVNPGRFASSSRAADDPDAAADPEDPNNPDNPEDPDNPVDPKDPDNPEDVDDPEDSILVKIMEDGTLKSAISIEQQDNPDIDEEYRITRTEYGKLTDVFLPPKESSCSDVYLLFDKNTSLPAFIPDENCLGSWNMGPLLAIHEDGSWTDILLDSPWNAAVWPIDSNKNIQIAPDGSLTVLFREAGGWEYYIRKYDPSTKAVKEICRFGRSAPLSEETDTWTEEDWNDADVFVERMKISKDGKWAYIQVRMNAKKQYIHVVSLDNPKDYKDIVLDVVSSGYADGYWDYDKESDKLYYLKLERNSKSEVTSKIIYCADSDGKNPQQFAILDARDTCDGLDVVVKDTVWIRSSLSLSDEEKYFIFKDVKTDNEIRIPVNINFYCDDYCVKDDAIYLRFRGGDSKLIDNKWCYKKNEIIRVSIPDGEYIKYSANLDEGQDIMIISWNVGESKIYITGESNDEPANYAIDIDGNSRAQQIGEGYVFTCIGSLK